MLLAGALMTVVAAGAGSAAVAKGSTSPAEEAAAIPTPSCAEGPTREADVIVGTDCADTIVVPPTVTAAE